LLVIVEEMLAGKRNSGFNVVEEKLHDEFDEKKNLPRNIRARSLKSGSYS